MPEFKVPTIGRDSMNLVEFPISVMGDHVPDGTKTITREDFIPDRKRRGQMRRRTLKVTGSDDLGLPTAVDDDVMLALIQVARRRNDFRERLVHFTVHEVCLILRWNQGGSSYRRILESMNRWTGVVLTYHGAWYDTACEDFVTKTLHVIDNLEVNHGAGRRHKTDPTRLSWFRWDDVFIESLRSGYLKDIDLELYFSLRSRVARRIYRYVSKYFYKKPEIRRDLAVFAYEKIGVARLGDLGQVKRLLRPALAELEQKGFLAATGDARRYQKEGRGKWTICLVEAHADPSVIEPMPLLDPPAPSRLPVVDDLMARGVVEHVASDLVARYGVERAARQVGWLDERPTVKDPPAFLVKAIENNYPPPIKATRPSKPLAAPAPTPSPITPEKKREIVEEREFEAYLDTLGQDRLEEIQRIAIAEADEAQKQRVRHRVLGRMAALALRNDYIRNNLYKKDFTGGN